MLTRFAVVVPAHDEQDLLPTCLAAIRTAAAAVRPLPVEIVVVADRCTDATAEVAAAAGARVVTVDHRNVGRARAAGMTEAMRDGTTGLWLATTDADSRVPPTWLDNHRRHAARGTHLVVGTVAVDDWTPWPESVRGVYDSRYSAGLGAAAPDRPANGHRATDPPAESHHAPDPANHGHHAADPADKGHHAADPAAEGRSAIDPAIDRRGAGGGHRHVHGANLGCDAGFYRDVGGFAALRHDEDRDLVERMLAAGARVAYDVQHPVVTSARPTGRAPAGFAAFLRDLAAEPTPPTVS